MADSRSKQKHLQKPLCLTSCCTGQAEMRKAVLNLRLNFNQGPTLDKKKLVCTRENAVSLTENTRRKEARTRVVGTLNAVQYRLSCSALSWKECKAIKSLDENEDVVISPAGKGTAAIPMLQSLPLYSRRRCCFSLKTVTRTSASRRTQC